MPEKIPYSVAERIRTGPSVLGQVNQQLMGLLRMKEDKRAREAAGRLAEEKLALQKENLALRKARLNLDWNRLKGSLGAKSAGNDLAAIHAVQSFVEGKIKDEKSKALSPLQKLIKSTAETGGKVDAAIILPALAEAKKFNPMEVVRNIPESKYRELIEGAKGNPDTLMPYFTYDLMLYNPKDALKVVNARRMNDLVRTRSNVDEAQADLESSRDIASRLGGKSSVGKKQVPKTDIVFDRLEKLVFEQGPEKFYQNKNAIRRSLKKVEKLSDSQVNKIFRRMDRIYTRKKEEPKQTRIQKEAMKGLNVVKEGVKPLFFFQKLFPEE